MSDGTAESQIRRVGVTAWRATLLAGAAAVALVIFLGMALLVYRGQMSDGPLILFSGVVLGYLLRAVRDVR